MRSPHRIAFVDYLSVIGDCNCRFELCEDEACLAREGLVYASSQFAFAKIDLTEEFDTIGVINLANTRVYYMDENDVEQNNGLPFNALFCDKAPEI